MIVFRPMKISNTCKGVSCVCGAFLIHFSLGTIYTFGNMSPYMASYLRLKTDNVWMTTGHTVWILAATFFLMGTFMAVGGLMQKKCGSRLTCLFGCWTMSLSVMLTYFTIRISLLLVIVTYGLGFGFGIGMSYSVALTAAMKWYPLKRGMISGIVVGGFGLGSFLFNLVQTKIINPLNIPPRASNVSSNISSDFILLSNFTNNSTTTSNEKYFFDEMILNNVPICFLIIGGTYAVIQLLGVILLMDAATRKDGVFIKHSNLEKDQQESMLMEETKTEEAMEKTPISTVGSQDFSVLMAIRNKMFWLLWSTFFFNGIVIVTISAVYKSFGQQFIGDDQFFSILGAVGGILNCVGRVIWGHLNDKFSYRIVMTALTIMMTVTMGTFYFVQFISDPVAAMAIYFIWGCLLFLALSGSFAILPCAASECFGSRNLAMIYGLICIGLGFASITGAIISSFLFKYIQYHGQFIIASIAAIISLVLTQFFRPPNLGNQIK